MLSFGKLNGDKSGLRQRMREVAAKRMDAAERSGDIIRQLSVWPVWKTSDRICAFCGDKSEPQALDPWPEDKRIALPRVSGDTLEMHWIFGADELVPGHFGIYEPHPNSPSAGNGFDLILVPGLAFDTGGGRLGRGKGYYDRFLAGARGFCVGLCFDDQIVERVPMESHDQRMDFVVTPSAIYSCGA